MSSTLYTVKCENGNVNALNYQEFGVCIATADDPGEGQVAAQLLLYVYSVGLGAIATLTSVSGIRKQVGAAAGSDVPFPYAEIAAMVATAGGALDGFNTAIGSGYNHAGLGTGALSPLGTSIVVTEYNLGPSGRHFLPFTNVTCLDAAGFVNSANRGAIADTYGTCILTGDPAIGAVSLSPCVVSSRGSAITRGIDSVKPQPVASNLRSRRY